MSKNLILLAAFVFSLGVLFGIFDSWVQASVCVQKYKDSFTSLLGIHNILIDNIKVVFFMSAGFATFGTTTTANLLVNGYIMGVTITTFYPCLGLWKFMAFLLPHGILEIPAIILAGAAGFKILYEVVRYLLGRKENVLTKEDIKEYLTLALISIVLIIIAAWIEANVTLRIAKAMVNSTY